MAQQEVLKKGRVSLLAYPAKRFWTETYATDKENNSLPYHICRHIRGKGRTSYLFSLQFEIVQIP